MLCLASLGPRGESETINALQDAMMPVSAKYSEVQANGFRASSLLLVFGVYIESF
jgi:hypothetical protein